MEVAATEVDSAEGSAEVVTEAAVMAVGSVAVMGVAREVAAMVAGSAVAMGDKPLWVIRSGLLPEAAKHWLNEAKNARPKMRVVVAAVLCELRTRRDNRVLLTRSMRQRRESSASLMQSENGCGAERGERSRWNRGG